MTIRPSVFLATTLTLCVLLPRHAYAQTPPQTQSSTTSETRIVSDPLFLPLKGQVYGATSFTLDQPKGDNFKAGVQTGSFKASDNLFTQTLAFGLLDDLTVRVTEGYGVNNRDSTSAATGDVTTGSSRGFNDPTLSATLRLIDQPRQPFIVDVAASYSPDLVTSKSGGNSGMDGTLGRGGQSAGVSLAVGRVMDGFTIAATAAGTYVGEQTNEVLSNGTSTLSGSRWNRSVGVSTQMRFSDRASFDAGASMTTTGDYDVVNVDKSNAHTYSPPDARTINLALNYHFQPNRVVGQITYSYNNYSVATNTFAKATSNTSVENRMGNVFGVRLLYVFN